MSDSAVVLVHSPLVGPLTWRPVAECLADAGFVTAVPDLTAVMAGPAPYQPAIARAVAVAAQRLGRPVVLVGHSGADPLLPGIAAAVLPVPVEVLVYADAALPYPGRTWFETAPAELAGRLRGLADNGQLPPWHEWFPPEVLPMLVPDPQLRARLVAELSPLPLAYFHEPAPEVTWPGPSGYLLLSEAYQDEAERAAQLGIAVVERRSHHLAPLTSPEPVAAGLQELLTVLTAPRQRGR